MDEPSKEKDDDTITMKTLFYLFREKAEGIYGEDGTPLSEHKANTENSTQFCNNSTKIRSDEDQKVIEEAKEKGRTLKPKLWKSLKQDERMEIIAQRDKNKASQLDKDQLPKQYGLNNVRIFIGQDGLLYTTEDYISTTEGGQSVNQDTTPPSYASTVSSGETNNTQTDNSATNRAIRILRI